MPIVSSIWSFYCCKVDFDFYSFIGIFTEFLRPFSFTTEEERRFKDHRRGSCTPELGVELRLFYTEFSWRDWLNRGARLSVLMRQSAPSISPLFSSHSAATGALHLIRFYTIFTESLDSFCALVRKSVSSIVLHFPFLLLPVDMWPGR